MYVRVQYYFNHEKKYIRHNEEFIFKAMQGWEYLRLWHEDLNRSMSISKKNCSGNFYRHLSLQLRICCYACITGDTNPIDLLKYIAVWTSLWYVLQLFFSILKPTVKKSMTYKNLRCIDLSVKGQHCMWNLKLKALIDGY